MTCTYGDCIVRAPTPSRLIARHMAGPDLLANATVSKFADQLPCYRQSVIYVRDIVALDPGLLSGWPGACFALLKPLVDAIRQVRPLARINDFELWIRAMLLNLSHKSDTTAAIMYSLNLRPALKLYCNDGERAAVMYILIGTAKSNRVDSPSLVTLCSHPHR